MNAKLDPTKLDTNTGNRVRIYSDFDIAKAEKIRDTVLGQIDVKVKSLGNIPQIATWHEVRNYLAEKLTSVETWLTHETWSAEQMMMYAYQQIHGQK